MATKAKPLSQDISQVRIPGKLLTKLSHFLNSRHQRIIHEAAARAFARESDRCVTSDDILQSAQSVLSSSLTELADLLKSNETSHGRKKAMVLA
jgi:hypothetical protein